MPSKNIKVGATDLGEAYANLVGCLSNLGNIYSATGMNVGIVVKFRRNWTNRV